jgi:hypothetical protein
MKGDKIYYRDVSNYKYVLDKDYTLYVGIIGYKFDIYCMKLTLDGYLTMKAGFYWDGPSGPTWDTPNAMRGSLIHDAIYRAIRLGLLPFSCKELADLILEAICEEDGMSEFRAEYWHKGVEDWGRFSCIPTGKPDPEEIIHTAP